MAKPTQRGDALAGLFADAAPSDALEGARRLPLALLDANPWQPRQHIEGVDELAADMAAHGLISPLVVRPVGDRWEIVAGERRYRAAQVLEWVDVPCLIQELDEATARALAVRENIHRADMAPEEIGRYFASLAETGMSLREIGAAIGKSHMYVQRYTRLAQDPDALAQYQAGEANLADIGRGAVDSATGDYLGQPAAPERNNLLQEPPAARHFRRHPAIYKPLYTFMDWVATTDPQAVPPDERAKVIAALQQAKAWVLRWEIALMEDED